MKQQIIYQDENFQVAETIYGGRRARVLYDHDRRAAQSGVPLDSEGDMLFDYNERLMEIARGIVPQRVLVIGGGACTLPQVLQQEIPGLALDIIELDNNLPKIAEAFFDFVPDARTVMHVLDGRSFINTCTKTYDYIVVDAYHETTIPPSLQTVESAQRLAELLNPHGVLAINIISGYYGNRAGVLRRQVAAWSKAFNTLQLFPASVQESLWLPQNFVLTAQNNTANLEPYVRHRSLAVPAVSAEDFMHD